MNEDAGIMDGEGTMVDAAVNRRDAASLHAMLEELAPAVRQRGQTGEKAVAAIRSAYAAIEAGAAELLDGQQQNDLRVRYYCLVAGVLGRERQIRQAELALLSARYYFERGAGNGEIRLKLLETEALVAAADGRFEVTRSMLERAALVVRGHGSPGHQAEVLLRLGKAIVRHDPAAKEEAARVFHEGLEKLAAPGVSEPFLLLGLTHELARVETVQVFWDLVLGGSGDAEVLATTAARLHRVDHLYDAFATPRVLAQREVIRGRILLISDQEAALCSFTDAVHGFGKMKDCHAAARLLLDLLAYDEHCGELKLSMAVWRNPEQRELYPQVVEVMQRLSPVLPLPSSATVLRFLQGMRR